MACAYCCPPVEELLKDWINMHIGVFSSRQSGGGFTFVTELLMALSKLAKQSHYKFTLLVPSIEEYNMLQPYIDVNSMNIAILSSKKKYDIPYESKESIFRSITVQVINFLKGKKKKQPDKFRVETIEEFARANDIQVIWFVDQSYGLVPDIPYIATLWDIQHRLQPFFPEVSNNGIWDRREKGLSRYLQRAAFVVAGSKTASNEIERFYQVPAEKIKILRHPTPGFAFSNSPISDTNDVDFLKKYNVSTGYLFYPAQFWAHKNHVNLLLALNLLREKYDLCLNMVFVGSDHGNGEYINQKIEDLNLTSQVTVLGFVSQSDLVMLYRNALALTYVTYFGPDNLPPLEAFALGCPVIASNVSGAHEQLGNSALLVNPSSPVEIAEAIWKVYKSPKLRSDLVQRGKKRASSWTNEDFVQGIFKILDEFEPIRRTWH